MILRLIEEIKIQLDDGGDGVYGREFSKRRIMFFFSSFPSFVCWGKFVDLDKTRVCVEKSIGSHLYVEHPFYFLVIAINPNVP